MTCNATALLRENATRARENREHVRCLLAVRQPRFAAALESAVDELLRDRRMACARTLRENARRSETTALSADGAEPDQSASGSSACRDVPWPAGLWTVIVPPSASKAAAR
jgi:hypothetical protein